MRSCEYEQIIPIVFEVLVKQTQIQTGLEDGTTYSGIRCQVRAMHQPWTLRKRHALVLRIHAETSVSFPETLWFLGLAACADAWNTLEVWTWSPTATAVNS